MVTAHEGRPRVFVGGPFSAALSRDGGRVSFDPRLRMAFDDVHLALSRAGAEVWSSHVAEGYGAQIVEEAIVPRDNNWMRTCDIYVALLPISPAGVPYRTDGTYVEIGFALGIGKRIVLISEDPFSEMQSYYVRNLHAESAVCIIEWNEYFADIDATSRRLVASVRHG